MESDSTQLFLHEEIFLLALKDEAGTIASGAWYSYAIGGAVLAELALTGRLKIVKDGKKKFCELVDNTPFGNEVLDECLDNMAQEKKRRELSTWLNRFAGLPKLSARVAIELCKQKILNADETTVLWIFTRKIYPERDPNPEREIIERVRRAVFTDVQDLDSRTLILTVLADVTGILSVVFEKQELKARRKRIDELATGELVADVAKEAIAAINAAIFVAVILPAVTVNH